MESEQGTPGHFKESEPRAKEEQKEKEMTYGQ